MQKAAQDGGGQVRPAPVRELEVAEALAGDLLRGRRLGGHPEDCVQAPDPPFGIISGNDRLDIVQRSSNSSSRTLRGKKNDLFRNGVISRLFLLFTGVFGKWPREQIDVEVGDQVDLGLLEAEMDRRFARLEHQHP